MRIVVNGEEQSVNDSLTLAELVAQLAMKPDRVAIELNRSIIGRERWADIALHDGDRLEIVHFVGGGSGVAL